MSTQYRDTVPYFSVPYKFPVLQKLNYVEDCFNQYCVERAVFLTFTLVHKKLFLLCLGPGAIFIKPSVATVVAT